MIRSRKSWDVLTITSCPPQFEIIHTVQSNSIPLRDHHSDSNLFNSSQLLRRDKETKRNRRCNVVFHREKDVSLISRTKESFFNLALVTWCLYRSLTCVIICRKGVFMRFSPSIMQQKKYPLLQFQTTSATFIFKKV